MQDYRIIVQHGGTTEKLKTNPQYIAPKQEKVVAEKPAIKEYNAGKLQLNVRKAVAVGTATGMKINQWVGELTENKVTQQRIQAGFTIAGIGYYMISNPIQGGIAMAAYVGNAAINYEVKNYKENLSANYLKQLSGGTVNTRG
ncbi:MAG: hypothetical protein M0R51_08080 [Clostridia bacterium]|jgi:hypothetical protein|nr:hypothetical protein [Clostridia bacterium]